MTPDTRAVIIRTLGIRHDDLIADLHLNRMGVLAKGAPGAASLRTQKAHELREIRRALRELNPRASWPRWYGSPEQALAAWQRESR